MDWTELSIAIPFAALCLLVSGFCSGTEVALFSLRRVDREQMARSGRASDRRVLAMLERPRRLIATVLIGNEALNSVLAVLALGVTYRLWPQLTPWGCGGVALAVTLPLVVLIGEVTAKTLAAKTPVGWSRIAVLPLSAFALLVTPARLIVHGLTELLLRPLGDAARTRPSRDLSEEEFRTLVDAGSAQGQVNARERRLIHRVFEFSDKNVGQVMTPRERMFALSYELPTSRLAKEIAARGFSRVPIYQKSLDNIRGTLNAKDLVRAAAGQTASRPLAELLHEPLFVPRTTPVKRLFLTFKQKKVHMAIVVSEYGKVLGLVTMDDLLSQIFGVMRDERAALQAGARGRGGRTPLPNAMPGSPQMDTGPVRLQTGPIPIAVPDSGPHGRATSEPEADFVGGARSDSDPGVESLRANTPGTGTELVDPPPMHVHAHPHHAHHRDEDTPPAIDIAEIAKLDEHSDTPDKDDKGGAP